MERKLKKHPETEEEQSGEEREPERRRTEDL